MNEETSNPKSAVPVSRCCGKCVHVIPIPGNCHIGCGNPTAKPTRKSWAGCGLWPLSFDPVTVQSCDGYSENPKDKIVLKKDPLLEFVRLLAG